MVTENLFWSLCYIISMFFPLENIEICESYVYTYIWQMNIYLKSCATISWLRVHFHIQRPQVTCFCFALIIFSQHWFHFPFSFFPFHVQYLVSSILPYASLSTLDGLFYFSPNFYWRNCKCQNLSNNFHQSHKQIWKIMQQYNMACVKWERTIKVSV